jgi:phosphoglycerate kinase
MVRSPSYPLQREEFIVRSIDDLQVAGRRVLVRADLNVPLDGGRIADDGRIRASLPTLTTLTNRGAKVIVFAHLGRPGGKPDPNYSLAPVVAWLGELILLPHGQSECNAAAGTQFRS